MLMGHRSGLSRVLTCLRDKKKGVQTRPFEPVRLGHESRVIDAGFAGRLRGLFKA